jgi:drug/metabolite transporter (DMT)-like permease
VLAVSSLWFDVFPERVSATAWASAFISGVLYYAAGFWLYLIGLRMTSAAVAGSFLNLIPFFGIAAGFILLDETFSVREWLGAGLIVAAMTLVLRHQDQEAARLPLGSDSGRG